MNDCPKEREIEAYHDGELPAEQIPALEAHLAQCNPCQLILQRMVVLSRLISESAGPQLSQIARARVYRRVEAALDRGLVRLAWTFSGMAASVLLAGSLWLASAKQTPAAAPPWISVAYSSETGTSAREPATPAAEWYLADASGRSDEQP
jgi:anti-sigma factor RsiW